MHWILKLFVKIYRAFKEEEPMKEELYDSNLRTVCPHCKIPLIVVNDAMKRKACPKCGYPANQ